MPLMTWMPFTDFSLSMACLRDDHLLKQRKEAFTILQALKKKGWYEIKDCRRACRMWEGYAAGLVWYYNVVCAYCEHRKLPNDEGFKFLDPGIPITLPNWIGNQRFHNSHKAALIRLDPLHYETYWFGKNRVQRSLLLFWPV